MESSQFPMNTLHLSRPAQIRLVYLRTYTVDLLKLLNRYGGDKNLEDLKTFIKHKTGVYLNLPGCLKEFDDLASKFIKADEKGKSKIFAKAQKELSKEQEEDQPKARKYLKIMKLLQEKGPSAIADEEARIKKLLAGEKMSDEKRKDLAKSLNVLKSFGNPEKSVKDEL